MTTLTKSFKISRLAAAIGNRVVALIFLMYFAPVMLAVAFLIKLDSHGPVFRKQSRRCANGELIGLLEFRTIVGESTEFNGVTGYRANQTELGAFLCQSRLELLPRLVNMLRGEVSFGALLR
jgi:lipopolysaccharide/colanic/teichoic acid biosynthesis glycosyltransferase